ncbi:Serine/threonine-protein kinase PrkC [Aquisphaera giovannonii]|uniref:Serine/threonine-protein kinase PrkC n=1 Tax=Aquisphaera giovannonii TaxID=406548 RepID=A0A5B9W9B9_9BACT|nr:protein kinase [Aquisphaera giovannonii]QEH37228.1 Serine/threonine-protein kinase PrkC [Aquisphaera giovannonii]
MTSVPAGLPTEGPDRERRLNEAIAAYLEAVERGEAPDRAAILGRAPDLEAELASFFANLDHLERLSPAILPFPASTQQLPPADPPAPSGAVDPPRSIPGPVRYFGDYEILDVLARGGMGIVYRARQVSLDRTIALKMTREGRSASPEDLVRFRLEAGAVALLDHPNIVPIYESGEHEGYHYYSMKLVEGGDLAAWMGRFRGDFRASARLMATVARAVHYAHRRGILHRDLKPANIMLAGRAADPPDRLIPVVADFGLAKHLGSAESHGLTTSGSVVGTPGYMAPEQAEGKSRSASTAVDIHALGAILFEMLAGRPLFRGETVVATLQLIREAEAPRLRSIDPLIPRDLETIVATCLRKSPEDRYPSAEALAEDLERWLDDRPIRARPASIAERAARWARRRPAVAASLALAAVATIATALAIRGHATAARAESERDAEATRRVQAEAGLGEAAKSSAFELVAAAERAWEGDDPSSADEWLDRCPEPHRGWEWYHLRRRFHSELLTLRGHNGFLCAASFKPNGEQVACVGEPAGLFLWDAQAGRAIRHIPGHDGLSYGLAFDRSGTRLAVARPGGWLGVYELKDGSTLASFQAHRGWAAAVAFSEDGTKLASSGQDGIVRLWDLAASPWPSTAASGRTFRGHAGPVFGVALSADGRRIASAGDDGAVRIWSIADPGDVAERVLRGHAGVVRAVTFHPSEPVLASAGEDRVVRVWDIETGSERLRFGDFGNRVDGLAYSPDGRRIATACLDRSVRVWDARTGELQATFHGHAAPVFSVRFSPDGSRLASASQDACVKVWDLRNEPGSRLLAEVPHAGAESDRPGWVGGLAFHPSGVELAVGGVRRSLVVWNPRSGAIRRDPHTGWPATLSVRYSPEGQRLAVAGTDRVLRILDATTLDEIASAEDYNEGIASLAFHPSGKVLATGGGDPLRVVQEPSGKMPSADGRPRSITLRDPATGSPLRTLSGHVGSIHALAYTRKGDRLISAGSDGLIRVWDHGSGRLVRTLNVTEAGGPVHALAVSPDGRILASAGAGKVIELWDLETGRRLRTLAGHSNWILALTFHPDGSRLASAGGDRTIRIWDPETGREALTLRGHRDRVHGLAFSPDGRVLASASADGAVRVWEAEDRPTGEAMH